MMQTYKSLQACRGVAALLVVLHHLSGALADDKYFGFDPFARVFSFGGTSGVAFFFVLSGFIIVHAHGADFGRPDRLRSYLLKRAIRIYPTYWIIYLAVYLTAIAVPGLGNTASTNEIVPIDNMGAIFKSLLLIPQYRPSTGTTYSPVLVVAWTLQYEILYYSLIAFAIISRALATIVVFGMVANSLSCLDGCSFARDFISRHHMVLFAMGACIAYLLRKVAIRVPNPSTVIVGGGSFLAIGASEFMFPSALSLPAYGLTYGLSSAILILGLVHAEDSGKTYGGYGGLRSLGDASYALYLIHYPAISVLCKIMIAAGLTGTMGAVVSFLVILIICLAVSLGFHCWLERPLLDYFSWRAFGRRRPALVVINLQN
jgi:exopolysaccharide production protein ExoZ